MTFLDTLAEPERAVAKPSETRRLVLGLHLSTARKSSPPREPHVQIEEAVRIAQLAEAANFDMVFRGDFIQFRKEALNPQRPAFAADPLVELAALAVKTKRIGLVATLSTTFNVPYILARQLQTLDNISGGRVGWNAVTSFDGEAHFGLEALPEQEERYARAGEFLDILHELWSSWTPGSVYRDEDGRIRVDKDRIRDVDYRGTYHSSKGGLGVPRSKQGWPVQFQAGASAYGIAFAGKYAEAIYSASPTAEHAADFYSKIQAASRAAGRDKAPVILPGLVMTLADTHAEAVAKYKAANADINFATGIKALEGQLGNVKLGGLDLDKPVPRELFANVGADERRRISRPQLYRALVDAGKTLREILEIHSIGNSHHIFVGSYEEAATFIRNWWSNRLVDGFLVGFHADEHGLENFIDNVVPELSDVRAPIEGDVTLRQRLGLEYPG